MDTRNLCVRWESSSAEATNFGTQFAITCFVDYKFGCMIASNTLFDSWLVFGVKLSEEDIAEIECLRVVAMATTFWLSMGYNFGCMIPSDTLFDSRGGFLESSYPMKT